MRAVPSARRSHSAGGFCEKDLLVGGHRSLTEGVAPESLGESHILDHDGDSARVDSA